MTVHLNTQADLEDAIHALIRQDPRLKPMFELTGMPALRRREPGFAGLAHIVTGQQLSTASAAAIWAGSARRSIRSIPKACARRAPIGSAGSGCRRPRSRP